MTTTKASSESLNTLRCAIEMARDRPVDALSLFDQGIDSALLRGDISGCVALAKHAGVVSQGIPDLQRALEYYALAKLHTPGDARILIGLGTIYRELGKTSEARQAFEDGLALGAERIDRDVIDLAKHALCHL